MESEIHQPLGDVLHHDPAALLERPAVDDELVGDQAGGPGIEDVVVAGEALGHVVGVQDGDLARLGEPRSAEQRNVDPADGQDARASVGGRRHRALSENRIAGQEGPQVFGGADGPHAGAAASVGNREGLVEIDVADIGTDPPGRGQAHLGVEIGAVHVDLAPVLVDPLANLDDAGFENAVGRRVGDHQGAQAVGVLRTLSAEVIEIDVARFVAGHGYAFEAGDDGAGRVGAVG